MSKKKKCKCPNKELDKMIAKVAIARENNEKSVSVFTTKRNHYKKELPQEGFGASDLKPKLYEAYKYMLLNYDVQTRPVNIM